MSAKLLIPVLSLLLSATAFGAFQPGEVIVKYKGDATRTRPEMNLLYQTLNVRDVKRIGGIMKGMEKLTLGAGADVAHTIEILKQNPAVEYAQPNYLLHVLPYHDHSAADRIMTSAPDLGFSSLCSVPGGNYLPGCGTLHADRPKVEPAPADVDPPVADPMLGRLYGMKKIGADTIWKDHPGNRRMIVAVIDTGADYNHEDLSANMWRNPNPTRDDEVGYDFVHDDGLPFDDHEHGTHTSGTVGAVGGNGKGVSGVNQRVSVMAVKFITGQGSGTTENAIRAIDYAVTHGAKVLSNSWGGEEDEGNAALHEAIDRAAEHDVLFIAAAGNDGVDNDTDDRRSFPAAFDNDNIISVAATDDKDGLAFFSNYGVKTTHLAAPGVNIVSTVPGNKYKQETGTSMACPHVAGAAALLWSMNRSLGYKRVKEILLGNVDEVPELDGKVMTGGRLNIAKALQSME